MAATAWTGRELIMWSGMLYTGYGNDPLRADGFAFDPQTAEWREIATSPLSARTMAASAWTGTEMLVWGGWDDRDGFFGDGAAYDPATDSWRTLPEAPIDARAPLHVWTGRELLVWGTAIRVDDRPRDGAAYDPATNTWRPIPEAPIELTDAVAAWTGAEMIVFGAALHGGNKPETDTAIAAAYDPATETWRRLPDSDLSPQASTAAWNGRDLVAWDYGNASAAYSPETGEWRRLGMVPLDDSECSPTSVAIDGVFFGDYCGSFVTYTPDEGWKDVSPHSDSMWGYTSVVAGPAVILIGRNVENERQAMLAYRPR